MTTITPIFRPQEEPETREPKRLALIGISLALFFSVLLAYAYVVRCGFINLDDTGYVLYNPFLKNGLSWEGVQTAFTTFYGSLWIPLTWISLMADVSLFGYNPAGFHAENAVLHGLTTVVLFLTLQRSTGAFWRSAIVAALFGLHPINVESVAWITERKNVLCGLFSVLTLSSYLKARGGERPGWYMLSIAFHAAALMAKPMAVVLPGILLLLDFWPLDRESVPWSKRIGEKLPFFVLSLFAAGLALYAPHENDAWVTSSSLPVAARLGNAVTSYLAYLRDFILPVRLATFYPHPFYLHPFKAVLGAGVLIGITIAAFRAYRARPYLLIGWLWFLGALVPMLGLVQVGSQARADRFTYLAQIGIFVAVVWWLAEVIPRRRRTLAGALTGVVLLGFGILTAGETRYWTDSLTLFERAIENTGPNAFARVLAAEARLKVGDREKAAEHFEIALRIQPDLAKIWYQFAQVLQQIGKKNTAAQAYWIAARQRPEIPEYREALADALEAIGEHKAAAEAFGELLAQLPAIGDDHDRIERRLSEARSAAESLPAPAAAPAEKPASLEPELLPVSTEN